MVYSIHVRRFYNTDLSQTHLQSHFREEEIPKHSWLFGRDKLHNIDMGIMRAASGVLISCITAPLGFFQEGKKATLRIHD